MKKNFQDVKCLLEVALAWVISAKNSLQNHGGFSPNQLVFGHDINLPSGFTDTLLILETSTLIDIIRKNMEAMRKARESYIQAESSEHIRRAGMGRARCHILSGWTVCLCLSWRCILSCSSLPAMKSQNVSKSCSSDTSTKTTSSSCMSSGCSSDSVNIDFSIKSINQIL